MRLSLRRAERMPCTPRVIAFAGLVLALADASVLELAADDGSKCDLSYSSPTVNATILSTCDIAVAGATQGLQAQVTALMARVAALEAQANRPLPPPPPPPPPPAPTAYYQLTTSQDCTSADSQMGAGTTMTLQLCADACAAYAGCVVFLFLNGHCHREHVTTVAACTFKSNSYHAYALGVAPPTYLMAIDKTTGSGGSFTYAACPAGSTAVTTLAECQEAATAGIARPATGTNGASCGTLYDTGGVAQGSYINHVSGCYASGGGCDAYRCDTNDHTDISFNTAVTSSGHAGQTCAAGFQVCKTTGALPSGWA